jgi:protein TonB
MQTALPRHASPSPGRVIILALLASLLLHLLLFYAGGQSGTPPFSRAAPMTGYQIQLRRINPVEPQHATLAPHAEKAGHSARQEPPALGQEKPHRQLAPEPVDKRPSAPDPSSPGHAKPAPVHPSPPPRLSMQSLLDQAGELPQPQGPRAGQLVYGSSARGPLWSQYMDDWVHKMERVGALNYPEEVRRQGLSGGPTLSVEINADGSLRNVRIYRSSGNATLDNAASSLVRSAAPFSAFPAGLAQQARSLEIRRKWSFSTDNDLSLR